MASCYLSCAFHSFCIRRILAPELRGSIDPPTLTNRTLPPWQPLTKKSIHKKNNKKKIVMMMKSQKTGPKNTSSYSPLSNRTSFFSATRPLLFQSRGPYFFRSHHHEVWQFYQQQRQCPSLYSSGRRFYGGSYCGGGFGSHMHHGMF